MQKINDKLYNWASDIAYNTLEQVIETSKLNIVQPHMALMPDAHLGKGATVGSVIPTKDTVLPSSIGVDIGCGVWLVKTQFKISDLPSDRSVVRHYIEGAIPLRHYNDTLTPSVQSATERLRLLAKDASFNPDDYADAWPNMIGSLGGGNHFLEISADEDNNVYLFLHSGSRGIGNKIGQYWIKIAKEQHPGLGDLAYLSKGTPEFDNYMKQAYWAQNFALENRKEMMNRMVNALAKWTNKQVKRVDTIKCHHNYISQEKHYGMDLYIARKGAIDAHKGVLGVIPGSMGTASYIVEGLGNEESFCTAPHGAGRDYSRRQAKETFTMEQFEQEMQGIEWNHSEKTLDEIPDAYKDINVVMDDARDLVKPLHTLHQLVNVKGD